MKIIGKICRILGILLLTVVVLIAAADAAWVGIPELKARKRLDCVDAFAQDTADISFAPGPQVYALGEATHGNADFQRLRLTVFRQLVEDCGVRAFALEADFGEAMLVDRYVQGGEGTAEDALSNLSFTIYHTQEMAELIDWMRDYNAAAAEDDRLTFYGFDMQNPQASLRLLTDFCRENGALTDENAADKLAAMAESGGIFAEIMENGGFSLVQDLRDELAAQDNDPMLLHAADCVLQAAELASAHAGDDYIKYNNIRDSFMAQNVQWIAEREDTLGRPAVMISGHNGHVAFRAQYYSSMGSFLREALGDKYFVIGTDYYKTVCNIAGDGGRGDHSFCSADPLAAQAKRLGGEYYLNFTSPNLSDELRALIDSPMSMGSLGEGYNFLMKLIPTSHRVSDIPSQLYSAMIYVYKASPISPA